jgi:hypothetical protein
VWEADSVATLYDFLEPRIESVSENEYFQVENKESIALPSSVTSVHAIA